MTKTVPIGPLGVANDAPFALISGPCQMESLDHARRIAGSLSETCERLGIPFIFKASYDKANRSSLGGQRGLGMTQGLANLSVIR
jgi:2-dehydro-3-deoxyphosphooctonate aldolase (KDO 8-P synthase)